MPEEIIVKSWISNESDLGKRLDLFLLEKCPQYSRTQIQGYIKESHITVDGVPKKAHAKIRPRQKIEIRVPVAKKIELLPEEIPLEVLYEDEEILVINKQPGLVVHPAPGHLEHTLVNAILNHCQKLALSQDPLRPGIVHRLDKDTSGCLMIAKSEESLRKIGIQFEKRKVMKQYLALVWGYMKSIKGELDLAIGRHPSDRKKMAVMMSGKKAQTTYEVIERYQNASLVRVVLKTGRTHQIRVHMSYLGHPVLGDSEYGKRGIDFSKEIGINRQMLHAALLGVTHPKTDQWMVFTAPMPEDMQKAINKLKEEKS